MIKINLLPLESFRQTASGQLSVTIFVVAMVLAGLGLYLANSMVLVPKVAALEKAKQEQDAKLKQISAQAAEASKRTEAFIDQLVKVAAISQLDERRRDQARLLMDLAALVNNQTSWLLSCNHSKGGLTIKGMATDHDAVAELLEKLEKMPLLTNVALQRAVGDKTINDIKLVTFDIKANTVFSDSSLLDEGLEEVNLPKREVIKKLVEAVDPKLASALDRNRQAAAKTL